MKVREFALIDYCSVDLLWHMRRPGPSDPQTFRFDRMVHDFESQIPKGEIVALGHSFGLRPLLRFSELYPNRLKLLIAEDSSPQATPQGLAFIYSILRDTPKSFKSRDEAKQYFDDKHGQAAPLSRFLLSNISEQGPSLHSWRFNAAALERILEEVEQHPQWAAWENLAAPVHLVVGGKSSFLSPAQIEECLTRRPKGTTHLTKIPEAGHWVHADQLEAFSNVVSRIVKEYIGSE
jgi:esterase